MVKTRINHPIDGKKTTPLMVDTLLLRCNDGSPPGDHPKHGNFRALYRRGAGTKGDERGLGTGPGGSFLAKESMVIYGDLMGFNGDLW